MAHRNQVPNLTPRGKRAQLRGRIASVALVVVAIAAIALTAYIWMARASLS